MVERGAPGVVAGCLENRADLPDRVGQLVVPPAAERRGPAVRCHEPEQHPQGGGLAGAIGSEQGRHLARLCHRADVIDCQHVPEGLRETCQFNGHQWRRREACCESNRGTREASP